MPRNSENSANQYEHTNGGDDFTEKQNCKYLLKYNPSKVLTLTKRKISLSKLQLQAEHDYLETRPQPRGDLLQSHW